MTDRRANQAIALLLCGLLASPALSPLYAADRAAILGKIIAAPPAMVNGLTLPPDATLLNGDRLTTGLDGWARVLLAGGEQIHLGANSDARTLQRGNQWELELARGQLTARTGEGTLLLVRSNGLRIAPVTAGTSVWEVNRLGDTLTQVTAYEGSLSVGAANRTVEVPAGRSARIETALETEQEPVGVGAGAGFWTTPVIVTVVVVAAAVAVTVPIVVANSTGGVVSPSGQ